MLRYFSRILIFTLILTAPLSFTGDKCPDFRPDFQVKESLKSRPATVIVQRRSVNIALIPSTAPVTSSSNTIFHTDLLSPKTSFLNPALQERAPPAAT